MDKWLVRTEQNVISGPYTAEKIREMIVSGKLGHQDEICGAGVYWIYLHETDEIKKQLGIAVPRMKSADDEEVTETDVVVANLGSPSLDSASHESGDADLPELEDIGEKDFPQLSESLTENTAVLSNRAFRQFRTKKLPAAAMGAASQSSAGVAPPAQPSVQLESAPSVVHATQVSSPAGVTQQPLAAAPVAALSREPMVAGESLEQESDGTDKKIGFLFLLIFTALALGGAFFVLRMRS